MFKEQKYGMLSKMTTKWTKTSSSTWMIIMMLIIVILVGRNEVAALDCYTCTQAQDNSECSRPEDLTDCQDLASPGMEFDTCQTKVAYSDADGIRITKRCVQGPCSLGGAQDGALGLGCDRSGSERNCETCCTSNGCNVSDGQRVTSYDLTCILALLFAALLF